MLSSLFFATVLAAIAVRADPTPTEPSPGAVFKEGGTCHIAWDVDTTDTSGDWKNMSIELMSGDNYNMVHITSMYHSFQSLLSFVNAASFSGCYGRWY